MIRSGSEDQPPKGRRGRSAKKGRRSWTAQQQPSLHPKGQQPPEPQPTRLEHAPPPTRQAYVPPPPQQAPREEPPTTGIPMGPREEPLTSAIPAASHLDVPPPPRRQPWPEPPGTGSGYRPVPPPPLPPRPPSWHNVPPPPRRQGPPPSEPPPPPRPLTRRMERETDLHAETYDADGYPSGAPRPTEHQPQQPPQPQQPSQPGYPKKLTVTRVAALRSRQLTGQAVNAFRRAAKADGADKSGLTALTYATMLNYASDAAMAVALANTLFFSATDADASKGKVALYLLITVAPFALVAPVIGPALDKVQRGRRMAMCAASLGQLLMCVVMATNPDGWLLYPAALGKMVLSKSFTVLKAAVTPRVVPPDITLAKTNARLTIFGLAAGGVFGAVAALFMQLFDSPGALWFTAVICAVGAVQGMRIPAWVEVTEGEVPASLSASPEKTKRQPMGRHVVVALCGNGTVRLLTGFLMMFAAFAVRAQTEGSPVELLLLLGAIAGAAGVGGFVGNAIGARITVGHPEQVVLGCIIGCLIATVVATILPGVTTAALVGLIGATASALAKNSLDAVIQDDLPEESRASAFGRSETVLQLAWVFGGATGVLLPPIWWLGFLVITVLLAVGLVQTMLTRQGASLLPWFGGNRPVTPWRTGSSGRRFPTADAVYREGPPAGGAPRP